MRKCTGTIPVRSDATVATSTVRVRVLLLRVLYASTSTVLYCLYPCLYTAYRRLPHCLPPTVVRVRVLPTAYCLPPTVLPPASCLLSPASCLLPPASCLLHPASCLLPPASCCLLPPASCLLPPASCLLPLASCLLPTAYYRYCLLPTAYVLLTAYCLYCLLPTACCIMHRLVPDATVPASVYCTVPAAYYCTYSRCYCTYIYFFNPHKSTSTKPTERTPRPRPNVAMLGRVPPKGLISKAGGHNPR